MNFWSDSLYSPSAKEPLWDKRARQLLQATQDDDAEEVQKWINEGASLEITEEYSGRSLLHVAVYLHRHDALPVLLNTPISLMARNKKGSTPLAEATRSHCEVCMRALLKAGADVESSEPNGFFPLLWAAEVSSEAHSYKCLNLLLSHGADANHQSPEGHTALFSSVCGGRQKDVELLLEHGAKVNIQDPLQGHTALHFAIECKLPQMVQLLLGHGADPSIRVTKQDQSLNALEYAQSMGHAEISAMLYAIEEMSQLQASFPQLEQFKKSRSQSL